MADHRRNLQEAREAFRQASWRRAFDAFSAARRSQSLSTADLWLLAQSAYLIGHEDAYMDALQEAHQAHLDRGEAVQAARCAFWQGLHLANRNEIAAATGWFGRAARLLDENEADCAERGYLLLPVAHQALTAGRLDTCLDSATRALEIGRRFGDRDLVALALHLQGRSQLRQGQTAAGLALLDETMIAAIAGELSPSITGLLYCSVISACRQVYAQHRVQEWTAALSSWCERQPDMVPYAGECRIYRAEILQFHGDWSASAEEARRAGEWLARGFEPQARGFAAYQLAEVHRLRGDFAAAEEAYREASRFGREPQPGLALLRLAQGDRVAATAAIRRALAETAEPLARAKLLPAAIEICLENGDLGDARGMSDELADVAAMCASSTLDAVAAKARGAVDLAEGHAARALASLRRACEAWRDMNAPYEEARARVLIARGCAALGDDDTAAMELDAARAAFERLGALPDLKRLETRGRRAASHEHGLTPRQRDVLALLATGRTNRAIARALSISEKTVARHVADIFTALSLSSRAAATAYAYEHHLIDRPE